MNCRSLTLLARSFPALRKAVLARFVDHFLVCTATALSEFEGEYADEENVQGIRFNRVLAARAASREIGVVLAFLVAVALFQVRAEFVGPTLPSPLQVKRNGQEGLGRPGERKSFGRCCATVKASFYLDVAGRTGRTSALASCLDRASHRLVVGLQLVGVQATVSLPVGRLRGGDTTVGICTTSLRIGLGQDVSGYAAGAHVHGRSPAVVYAGVRNCLVLRVFVQGPRGKLVGIGARFRGHCRSPSEF